MAKTPRYEAFVRQMSQSQKIKDMLYRAVELHNADRLSEAAALYRKILEIDGNHTDSLHLLGVIEFQLGNVDESFRLMERAIQIDPNNPIFLNNMGSAYREKGEYKKAVLSLEKAISLKPDFAEPYYNMGLALKGLNETARALTCLEKAVALQPDFAQALNAQLMLLQRMCSWEKLEDVETRLDNLTKKLLKAGEVAAEDPLTNIRRHSDVSHNLAVAQSWSRRIVQDMANTDVAFDHLRRGVDKEGIRIGYLSNNFYNHPVAHQIYDLFRHHDRDDFVIWCYSYGRDDKSFYARQIQQGCDKFVDLAGMGDRDAAERIYNDGMDILIDLVGHTEGNRLGICALRPAPVQVSYLGFLGTSGAPFFDYFIADEIVTPEEHVPYYIEKLVYLPDCYEINSPHPISEKSWDRKQFQLPEEGMVFCSFNNAYKLNAEIFDMWLDILHEVPGSVLWLLRESPMVEKKMRVYAEGKGIPSSRLVFSGRMPLDEHLKRLSLADLALDTQQYNGGATTSNALWAGVPVITLCGNHFTSRMSASNLAALGLSELITYSLEVYKELAVRLAQAPDELHAIREKLSENRLKKPLFDTPRFVRNLEKAYKEMWRLFQAGEKPKQIVVGK